MGVAKVVLNGDTLMDTTGKTVAADKMLAPYTALDKAGNNVTGNIAAKSSSDLTVSGATVTAPAGFYASAATKTISSGSATPGGSISVGGATVSTGTGIITLSKTVSDTPSVSAGYVSTGTAGNRSISLSTDMAIRSSSDLTASGATVTAPAGYYASAASKSVSSMTLPTAAASSATSGYTSKATIGRSTSAQYINIPPGYNSAGAYYTISAVANGTAGTPTATKGTVSNHQVSVTPSVTNTTGYITGGTKTGTAVTVTASELVSGTLTVDSDGTIDVTNYENISVPTGLVMAGINSQYVTESNVRKWKVTATVFCDPEEGGQEGWISTGTYGNNTATYSAIASGTTITPSTSAQTIGGANYMMEGAITVSAMPSMTLPTAASSTASGTSKATITPSTSARYINIPTGYNGTASYYKINAMTTMTLPTAASSSYSGTSKATITPSTSAQYINIPTGYNSSAAYYKINAMTALTLPTAPTTTYTGTKVGSNIERSTSTRYINIPVGYNDTAKYYQISAVSNMALPTATSTTHTGTAKATITPSTANQYLNIPIGYNTATAYYTIAPGMIYEEGTFTPSADISHPSITFSNTHSNAPVYACIFDISDSSTQTTDSISSCIYTDVEKLIDSPFAYNLIDRYITVTASFKTSTGGNAYVGTMNYSSDNTEDSSKEYPRFWATETAFKPWANSDTRYFRSGRTYKWFAVWR